uniref:Uncharacterized protein n=1 Tax=Pan paniscus TaxID=9597 RepID=A0A2R9BVB4_PANPA
MTCERDRLVCEAAEGGRRQSEQGGHLSRPLLCDRRLGYDQASVRFETALVHQGLGHLGKVSGLSERLGPKGRGPRACSIQGGRPTERWSLLCKATLVSSWPQDSERDVWAIHLPRAGLEGACEAARGFCPQQQCWSGGAQRLL